MESVPALVQHVETFLELVQADWAVVTLPMIWYGRVVRRYLSSYMLQSSLDILTMSIVTFLVGDTLKGSMATSIPDD